MVVGEYFSEYDNDTESWCVFHTDIKSGYAYASYSTREQADQDAAERNTQS